MIQSNAFVNAIITKYATIFADLILERSPILRQYKFHFKRIVGLSNAFIRSRRMESTTIFAGIVVRWWLFLNQPFKFHHELQ